MSYTITTQHPIRKHRLLLCECKNMLARLYADRARISKDGNWMEAGLPCTVGCRCGKLFLVTQDYVIVPIKNAS
jgi:hypothetical protein